jgi:hypothetical protein
MSQFKRIAPASAFVTDKDPSARLTSFEPFSNVCYFQEFFGIAMTGHEPLSSSPN